MFFLIIINIRKIKFNSIALLLFSDVNKVWTKMANGIENGKDESGLADACRSNQRSDHA